MTDRESKICSAALEAVRDNPQSLRHVAVAVNQYITQQGLGNPMTESGVGAVIGKYGRATLKQFTRDGTVWIECVRSSG